MLRSHRRNAFVFLLCLIPASVAFGTNEKCPVLRDMDATDEYVTTYQGKVIRFCCNECIKEFEENTELYIAQVPQLQERSWMERAQGMLGANARLAIIGSLTTLLVGLFGYRYFCAVPVSAPAPIATSSTAIPPVGSLFSAKMTPTIPLIAVSGVLGYQVWALQHQIFLNDLTDEIHYATFYDFGYPPVPERPPVEETRLASDYYRGNDERSPKLFNNGNYRTAKFSISLRDAEGDRIEFGDEVSGKELFIQFDIERPPFTPDFLYLPRVMETMFLTKQCEELLGFDEPIGDRVDLTTVEPMQQWKATFPIGKLSCCQNALRGVIYVCEERTYQKHWWSSDRAVGGARMHYGIRYEIAVDDRQLAESSDMWMGSLYRTRKFPKWKVPMNQWFSHEPIPELPGKNLEDTELLGIDDHKRSHLGK